MPTKDPKKLSIHFFNRSAEKVAVDLLGKIMVHRLNENEIYRARIVETEAYVGTHDLACHASKGKTKRTSVIFGPAGHIYVYLVYGIHELFNVVVSKKDDAQAVLIRAAEPLDGLKADLSGPGKFSRGMKITRADYGLSLGGEKIFFLKAPKPKKIIHTKRVGVDFAKEWKDKPLRYYDADSSEISKRDQKADLLHERSYSIRQK